MLDHQEWACEICVQHPLPHRRIQIDNVSKTRICRVVYNSSELATKGNRRLDYAFDLFKLANVSGTSDLLCRRETSQHIFPAQPDAVL
jgi:hypothetical protein